LSSINKSNALNQRFAPVYSICRILELKSYVSFSR
jgi:hypothetical protein